MKNVQETNKRNELNKKEVEYFNGTEWKKISEYTEGERVLQYNIATEEATLANSLRSEKLKNIILNENNRIVTTFYYEGQGLDLSDNELRTRVHDIINGGKDFDKSWYKCNKHQLRVVTDEIIKHDINRQEHYNKLFHTIFTDNRHGIDFMQFACACCGLRAIIKENKKHGYELFITYRTNPTLEEFIKEVGNINKDKHYFKAPTGILVLRTKGNIFIKEN